MKRNGGYRAFEQRMFAALDEMEQKSRELSVAGLVEAAASVGLSVEDLLALLDAGVGPKGLLDEIARRRTQS